MNVAVPTTNTPPAKAAKFAGMDIRSSLSPDYGFCGALYGSAGSGKTTLAGSIVNSDYGTPALLVDAEGGADVVSHLEERGLSTIAPKDWSDIVNIGMQYKMGNRPYKSVIFDNLSEIQYMHIRSVVPEGQLPEIKHYNKNVADMVAWIRFWRDQARFHGINVVFVAWESFVKDENGILLKKGVQLRPKLAEQFPGIVNFVGYLYVEPKLPNWGRVLELTPDPKLDSKFRRSPESRAMQIPLKIGNPDLGTILDVLKGGKDWPVEKHDIEALRRAK